MATFLDQTHDPVEQLAAVILRLQDEVAALRSRSVRIPTLDADPDAADPTNIWRFDDGRLRLRGDDGQVQEFVPATDTRPAIPTFASDPAASTGWRLWFNGSTGELRGRLANGNVVRYTPVAGSSSSDGGTGSAGGSTTTKPKPASSSPKRYRKVYDATWGRTFCDRHGVETGARLRYGYYDGTHGERRVMLGFDDALIRSDLAGATVRRVELHMLNTDSWSHAGIDVTFGAHNKSGAPGSYSAVRRGAFTGRWPESGAGKTWRTVPVWFGRALRDGTIRGLTIDQPSNAASYYGEMAWGSVQLAITFTK